MSENHYNIFYYYYVHLNGLVSESVSSRLVFETTVKRQNIVSEQLVNDNSILLHLNCKMMQLAIVVSIKKLYWFQILKTSSTCTGGPGITIEASIIWPGLTQLIWTTDTVLL